MSRLHHIALGARDPRRIADFYATLFELEQLSVHHQGDGEVRSIWLDLGGAILMVERTGADVRRVDGIGAGPFLLAFEVSDWVAFASRLKAASVIIEESTSCTLYFRDPEGNRVAASSYPDPK